MKINEYKFSFEVYDSIEELAEEDATLLTKARAVTEHAYAPYSHFHVGAVARLANGEVVTGTNQENASFPAGLCAERVLLASAAALYPAVPVDVMAISYRAENGNSDHPVSPCGICRQSLQEFEMRTGQPIRLILGGMEGKIYVRPKAGALLPFAFTSDELKQVNGEWSMVNGEWGSRSLSPYFIFDPAYILMLLYFPVTGNRHPATGTRYPAPGTRQPEEVGFLWLTFLTDAEYAHKKEYGVNAMLDLFSENRHPVALDRNRKSYV